MSEAKVGEDGGVMAINDDWAASKEGDGKEGGATVEVEESRAEVGDGRAMADVGVAEEGTAMGAEVWQGWRGHG